MKLDNEIILIEWDDSFASERLWEDKQDLEPLPYARCSTVGFLIEELPESITIVGTTSEHQVLGRVTIPRSAIRKIRRLRLGKIVVWPETIGRLA